ncbi:MAG TPA: hypothetical protein VMT24_08610 [Aggregatilineaceae bacterium]|nr:hypothetical protein [Aggregatilineaceae bacterium]
MSERYDDSGTVADEAEPITSEKPKRTNGTDSHQTKKHSDPGVLPGISFRELYEERNWTALVGLGLIAIGVLYLFQGWLSIHLNLWSLALLGVGGWLVVDAWKRYTTAGQVWVENTRTRLMVGGVAALLGLMGLLDVNWASLLLMGAGGWLGFDTWQKYEANGRVWTDRTRNRMFVAAALGVLGLFSVLHLGSSWPVVLIIIGAAMVYRRVRRTRS